PLRLRHRRSRPGRRDILPCIRPGDRDRLLIRRAKRVTRLMTRTYATLLASVLLTGCIDAEPMTPNFEQRVFSILGGLQVGEALTLFGESAQSIVLQGGEEGAQYVFIPFLAAEEGAIRLRVQVSGDALEQVQAPGQTLAPPPPSWTGEGEMR